MFISPSAQLKDFIRVEENIFDSDFCDKVVEEYKKDIHWEKAQTFKNNTDVRTNDFLQISHNYLLSKNKVRKSYDDFLFSKIFPLIREYADNFEGHLKYVKDSGFSLLRYRVGEYYKEHVDESPRVESDSNGKIIPETLHKRKLTVIIQLNDDFEGGGLAFFHRAYKTEVKKGSVIIFPSNYLFPHEALPVTKGTRYSLITWVD